MPQQQELDHFDPRFQEITLRDSRLGHSRRYLWYVFEMLALHLSIQPADTVRSDRPSFRFHSNTHFQEQINYKLPSCKAARPIHQFLDPVSPSPQTFPRVEMGDLTPNGRHKGQAFVLPPIAAMTQGMSSSQHGAPGQQIQQHGTQFDSRDSSQWSYQQPSKRMLAFIHPYQLVLC